MSLSELKKYIFDTQLKIDPWLKNFSPEYRVPIQMNDTKFFFTHPLQPIGTSEDKTVHLFELLKMKGSTLPQMKQKLIFWYLQILLQISDLYLHKLTN